MTREKPERPITVLVIDDSAANRRAITRILETAPGVRVVERAADGEEGLKKAIALKPEVITLDLEMPRLDGFAFLRLLNAQAPTPVIVLSSYRHPSDVFKALQLGAFDFVSKPQGRDAETLDSVRAELIEKVRAVRFLKPRQPEAALPKPSPAKGRQPRAEAPVVIGLGASTGGPPAVQRVLESLVGLPVCVLVAQHMPARFTEAFAQRLNQALALRVAEAKAGDPIEPGRVYVAPGGEQLELAQKGSLMQLAVKRASPADRHAPSVDRLFLSLADHLGGRARAVVLTGMGDDGAKGVAALGRQGAEVWAEAESTAVVFGMPQAAISTGHVKRVLPVDELGPALASALRARRP
ncbi:MAG: chemotaxis response regulator protein-glutamate methylesterase [Myxococcaceae bacterium]